MNLFKNIALVLITATTVACGPELTPPGETPDVEAGQLPLAYTGTTEVSHSFWNGTEMIPPPPMVDEDVVLTELNDGARVVVDNAFCHLEADLTQNLGTRFYAADEAATSCSVEIEGELVDLVPTNGNVTWSEDELYFFVQGDATRPSNGDTATVNVMFDGLPL